MAVRTRSIPPTASGATIDLHNGWSVPASQNGRGWIRQDRDDGDTFRLMYDVHPAIEGLHALRDALGVIVRGPDFDRS